MVDRLATRGSPLLAKIIESDADSRWHEFVSKHPEALPFHQPEWTSAVSEVFGYAKRFHVLENMDGAFVAAWPAMVVRSRLTGSRLLCMPFSHRAAPLVSSEEEARLLLDAVVKDSQAIGVRSVEVRDWPDHVAIPARLHASASSTTHVLDLSGGAEAVLTGMSSDIRYSIRRAQRNGVSVRISDELTDLDAFYRLYFEQRKRQQLLAQPKSFVRALHRNFLTKGKGFMTVAEHEGQPVCILLNVGHGPMIVGLDSGTDPAARKLRATPLAIWKSIEVACEQGYRQFDFGRSPATAAGLQRFKAEWGTRELHLTKFWYGRETRVNTGNPDPTKRAVIAVSTKLLPDNVMSVLSRQIYKHLA